MPNLKELSTHAQASPIAFVLMWIAAVLSACSGRPVAGRGATSGTGGPTSTGSGGSSPESSASATGSVNGMQLLTVTITGQGDVSDSPGGFSCGSGTCTSLLRTGTAVALRAVPASGQSFTGWGGACAGTGSCAITVDGNTLVTAAFSGAAGQDTLTVTVGGDGSGSVTSSPAGIHCTSGSTAGCSHSFGPNVGSVTLTATPSATSSFAGWSNGTCDNGGNYSTTCPIDVQQY